MKRRNDYNAVLQADYKWPHVHAAENKKVIIIMSSNRTGGKNDDDEANRLMSMQQRKLMTRMKETTASRTYNRYLSIGFASKL